MIRTTTNRGFSLTEVLVAMAIFTVGMVGILAMFTRATHTHSDASDRLRAQKVLTAVLDDVAEFYARKYLLSAGQAAGYPTAYEAMNDIPLANPLTGKLPPGWLHPVTLQVIPEDPNAQTTVPGLPGTISYDVYIQTLPNTAHPLTQEPLAGLATVTVYWLRQNRVHTMVGERVIRLQP